MPSLANYKNEEVFVIGGKENVTCEVFSLKSNKWSKLKNLPSERFGCSLICEEFKKFLYLFGGIDTSTNHYNQSVLKYNLKSNLEWETLIVLANPNLLARGFAGNFKTKNNGSIIMLGGSTSESQETDDIVEFNLYTKTANLLKFKLKIPANFMSYQNFEDNELNENVYGFDNNNIIHKLNISNKESYEYKFDDYMMKHLYDKVE